MHIFDFQEIPHRSHQVRPALRSTALTLRPRLVPVLKAGTGFNTGTGFDTFTGQALEPDPEDRLPSLGASYCKREVEPAP